MSDTTMILKKFKYSPNVTIILPSLLGILIALYLLLNYNKRHKEDVCSAVFTSLMKINVKNKTEVEKILGNIKSEIIVDSNKQIAYVNDKTLLIDYSREKLDYCRYYVFPKLFFDIIYDKQGKVIELYPTFVLNIKRMQQEITIQLPLKPDLPNDIN